MFRRSVVCFVLLVGSVLLRTALASAEEVAIKFSECGALVDARGNFVSSARTSPIVFSNVYLGGPCGTVQASYLRGERTNNSLTPGMRCLVRATLKRRTGKGVSGKTVLIKNERWTTRARSKSNSLGRIQTSFTVLAGGGSYYLLGPVVTKTGLKLSCGLYVYDHMV